MIGESHYLKLYYKCVTDKHDFINRIKRVIEALKHLEEITKKAKLGV